MNKVGAAIAESVDEALSSIGDIDKDKFYQTLENEYGVKCEEIADNPEVLHRALKKEFPKNHHAIERKIMRFLHDSAKEGKYTTPDEIIAYSRVLEVFVTDIEHHIALNDARIFLVNFTRGTRNFVTESMKQLETSEHLATIGQSLVWWGMTFAIHCKPLLAICT